jgi:hypothetical protein
MEKVWLSHIIQVAKPLSSCGFNVRGTNFHPGTVEKVSPPPEDVARLFRALAGPKGSKEISGLIKMVKIWEILMGFHMVEPRTSPHI